MSQLVSIANEDLRLDYDPGAQTFSLTELGGGRTAVREGRLAGGGGAATIEATSDAVFGSGWKLTLVQEDGATVVLALYRGLRFALVRRTLVNRGAREADIQSSTPVIFDLDLGEPPSALRTLGTGGLLSPGENPGSYVFLACVVPKSRYGVVAGWLTHERGSGVLFSSLETERVKLTARIDYGHLRIAAGATACEETLAIGIFDDAREGLEQFAEAVARQYAIQLRPRAATYCTWYSDQHGGASDEASTVALAGFIARELADFGLKVVQIDDQWQDGPELDGPTRGFERARPNGPYPHGIAPVAAEMEKLGLILGLWWLPFGRNHADPAWRDRQDWFARWADGTPMRTCGFGGTCLDLTHPAVREHLSGLSRLYRAWGVKYYKMDGLWTGTATEQIYINDGYKDDKMANVAPFHDPAKTQIQAFREGLKLLRQSAGEEVFFSGCAISQNMRSFGASFGLVDAMRVGPDFNHDGLGIKTGPLRASRLYFLNGRVWWNDPDPTKVRASDAKGNDSASTGAVSLEMAKLTTSFSALTGQFFLISDWLPQLPPERLEILRRTMLPHEALVRPVDYFDNALPTIWLLEDSSSGVQRLVLGLFNWEKAAQTIGATLTKAGLDLRRVYHAFDYWNNNLLPDLSDKFSYELPPESCRIIALRAAEERPLLLSTSRHVTQGVVDIVSENWSAETLSGCSRLVAGDSCELRIRLPAGWDFVDASAEVPLTIRKEDGLVRITLRSPVTREARWSVLSKPCQQSQIRRGATYEAQRNP